MSVSRQLPPGGGQASQFSRLSGLESLWSVGKVDRETTQGTVEVAEGHVVPTPKTRRRREGGAGYSGDGWADLRFDEAQDDELAVLAVAAHDAQDVDASEAENRAEDALASPAVADSGERLAPVRCRRGGSASAGRVAVAIAKRHQPVRSERLCRGALICAEVGGVHVEDATWIEGGFQPYCLKYTDSKDP